ncbi:MAG: site-specific DNA-methyltransferase [Anaerolineales bacterium]
MSNEVRKNTIFIVDDNLSVLQNEIPSNSIDLIYIDPPFNTGKRQILKRKKTKRSPDGRRIGFNDERYDEIIVGTHSYNDKFDEYIGNFLKPRLTEAYRVLKSNGTLYFHIDYREVHYCKILLDKIFKVDEGKGGILNEIIWAYDYGGRSRKKWPAKHDNILVYVKNIDNYTFNEDVANNFVYKAPSNGNLVKVSPSDTWWHTIVPTNGSERTGYPTQKPRGILDRIVQVSSRKNDLVLDFFAGSGTTGESCLKYGRRFILVDNNPEAERVMRERFKTVSNIEWIKI